MFMVWDNDSGNMLGNFETLAEAKELFFELVALNQLKENELAIYSEDWKEHAVPREEIVAALEATALG